MLTGQISYTHVIEKIRHHFGLKNVSIKDIETTNDNKYLQWKDFYHLNESKKYKYISSYCRKNDIEYRNKDNEAILKFRQTPKKELNFFAIEKNQCVLCFTISNAERFTYDDAVWLSIHVFPEVIIYNPFEQKTFLYNQNGHHFYF